MSRMVEYCEWKIDAAPIMHGKLYRAAALIELAPTEDEDGGQRFVFNDLGDFETRKQAHERAIAWVKLWIDENLGNQ
jgi:hypothetical protein